MKRFKKQYSNQTIVLTSGLLIDSESIKRAAVQKAVKGLNHFMLEDVPEEQAAEAEPPKQPATGGGGAGDPRPKKTRIRTKK